MLYLKRHLSIILILLFALLAIAVVWWVFEKRLKRFNADVKTTSCILPTEDSVPHQLVYPL